MSIQHLNTITQAAFNDEMQKLGYNDRYIEESEGGGGVNPILAAGGVAGAGYVGYRYGAKKMGEAAGQMAKGAYKRGLMHGGIGGFLTGGAAGVAGSKYAPQIKQTVAQASAAVKKAFGTQGATAARTTNTLLRRAAGRGGRSILKSLGGVKGILRTMTRTATKIV